MYNHIVCSTDKNYAQHCAVLMKSVITTNIQDKFVFHILTDELDDWIVKTFNNIALINDSICKIHLIESSFFDDIKLNDFGHLTKATFYRLLLPSLLPNVSKALYLDVDIVVNGSLENLFKIDIQDVGLAAVNDLLLMPINDAHRELLGFNNETRYFNAGVLLLNLDFWRKNNIQKKLIDCCSSQKLLFNDQDALNIVFKGTWHRLPPKYNYLNMVKLDLLSFENMAEKCEYINNPVIIHFANRDYKPWNNVCFIKYRFLYKKYLDTLQWRTPQYVRFPIIQRTKISLVALYIILYNFCLRVHDILCAKTPQKEY